MPVIKGLEWTFDTVAARYENLRPGYTDDLYRTLFNYINIDSSCNVVEVGIGGGQATLPILKKGCALTAVEYGENFSKLCKKKFDEYENFSVITGKFENASFTDFQYDLPIIHIVIRVTQSFQQKSQNYILHIIVNIMAKILNPKKNIVIEEKIRTEFFSKIEETINQHGGAFTIYDTIDLQLARKP